MDLIYFLLKYLTISLKKKIITISYVLKYKCSFQFYCCLFSKLPQLIFEGKTTSVFLKLYRFWILKHISDFLLTPFLPVFHIHLDCQTFSIWEVLFDEGIERNWNNEGNLSIENHMCYKHWWFLSETQISKVLS